MSAFEPHDKLTASRSPTTGSDGLPARISGNRPAPAESEVT
jgi:hypothetical protein